LEKKEANFAIYIIIPLLYYSLLTAPVLLSIDEEDVDPLLYLRALVPKSIATKPTKNPVVTAYIKTESDINL